MIRLISTGRARLTSLLLGILLADLWSPAVVGILSVAEARAGDDMVVRSDAHGAGPAPVTAPQTAAPRAALPGTASATPTLPEGVSPEWWATVRRQLDAEAYAVHPAGPDAPATSDGAATTFAAPTDGAVTPAAAESVLTTAATVASVPGLVSSVATAGDVNGDGYGDVIVGVGLARVGVDLPGRAYIFLGSSTGMTTTPATVLTGEGTVTFFGHSAATAGDVNGDGFGDVIIGAYGYGATGGRTYVYYGSATGIPSGSATTANAILDGSPAANSQFGLAVASAGDVDGDGYSDVIVGNPGLDQVSLFKGGAAGLATSPWVTLSDPAAHLSFGAAVGTAGDVNGDGFADVIVGASLFNVTGNGFAQGRVTVYYGSATGVSPSALTTIAGLTPDGGFGNAVGTAGDVNGDGLADVIVGANRVNADTGSAYVFLGSASGLGTTPATTLTPGGTDGNFGSVVGTAGDVNGDGFADVIVGAEPPTRGYIYQGSRGGTSAPATTVLSTGRSSAVLVAAAGDVNGDGYADVITGIPSPDSAGVGSVQVYHGSPAVLSTTPDQTIDELFGPGGENGFTYAIATGDFNDDGAADVLVGAPQSDGGSGRVYVFLGRPFATRPLGTFPDRIIDAPAGALSFGSAVASVGDMPGSLLNCVAIGAEGSDGGQGRVYFYVTAGGFFSLTTTLTGEAPNDRFGAALSTTGDTNGDGRNELLVGAPGHGGAGRVYVFVTTGFGSTSLSSTPVTFDGTSGSLFGSAVGTAGDVNRDGFADVVIGAPGANSGAGRAYLFLGSRTGLATTATTTLSGAGTAGASFGTSVGTPGDLNGDGYSELAVGEPGSDSSRGAVYVFRGQPGGVTATPVTTLTGEHVGDRLGWRCGTAGDVNGDGFADLFAAAPDYDSGAQTGRVYVFTGSTSGVASGSAATASVVLTGETPGSRFGTGVASGDLNNDGYADLIVGAPGYQNVADGTTGRLYDFAGNASYGVSSSAGPFTLTSTTTRIPYLGRSDDATSFWLGSRIRMPFGRGRVKLQWEVKRLGIPFDGSGLGTSTTWQDTSVFAAPQSEIVSGLTPGTPYHWRIRALYRPATTPFAQANRWLTMPIVGQQETRLRTGGTAPDVLVSPTSGLVTTEAGGTATYTVVLTAQPSADVQIDLRSTNSAEGRLVSPTLIFTPANWNVPQQVLVTGQDDFVVDGSIAYSVDTLSVQSGDAQFNGLRVPSVSLTNLDNDTAGITVTPTSGLITSERGRTATFTVVLTSQPTASVDIGLSSSDTTEGTVSPASLTFTAANWNVSQTATVSGVDDPVMDGNIDYSIVTAPATSTDPVYNGRDAADVSARTIDDDVAGIRLSATPSLVTTEAGGTATFSLVLLTQPTANVDVTFQSSGTEVNLSGLTTRTLTFTPATWNITQQVTVTGLDDNVVDGDVGWTVTASLSQSTDANYRDRFVPPVTGINRDNDVAGITVTPTTGLATGENGTTATFIVVLTSQPAASVTIGLSSSDTTEGMVAPGALTFTAVNWSLPQTVTVTGVADAIVDGNVPYTIVTSNASSTDPNYANRIVADVSVTNIEGSQPSMTLTKTSTATSFARVGDAIPYRLVAQNTGNVPLVNVLISDPLLPTLTCAPAQPAALAPGATLTCTGTHRVTADDLVRGFVTNTATVTGAADDGVGSTATVASPEALIPVVANGTVTVFGIAPALGGTRVAFTTCDVDVRQDWIPRYTKLQFEVWNEDEVKFTGAYECADSWHETDFGQSIDAAQQNFTIGVLGTYGARYRVQAVTSTQCPGAQATGLLGVQSMTIGVGQKTVGTTLVGAGKFTGSLRWDPSGTVSESVR